MRDDKVVGAGLEPTTGTVDELSNERRSRPTPRARNPTLRELGLNPRALGLNPRALGLNPRVLGTNPDALRRRYWARVAEFRRAEATAG